MKLFMTDPGYRYDIEALAREMFKTEEMEITRDPGASGPLLAVFHETAGENRRLRVLWKNSEGLVSEREEILPKDAGDALEEKKRIHKKLKLLLAKAVLGDDTSEILPWGILTGIKPSKLVHDMLDEGLSFGSVKERLHQEYLISSEKIDLVTEVARQERDHIYPADPAKIAVYIGIPFCPSKCLYCSFPTTVGAKESVKSAYIEALSKEIRGYASELEPFSIESLYIGGGTPTALTAPLIKELFGTLADSLNVSHLKEFTMEAGRPDTVDDEKLALMKTFGVDRISINPQTFNDRTLQAVRRGHTAEDVYRAMEKVATYGFDSVNMDLIVGLPTEGAEEMRRTMEALAEIQPDNLTVHTLALKKNAEMRKNALMKTLPDEETARKMLRMASDGAALLGMKPYYMYRQKYMLGNLENIGFAKPGKTCLYNMQMMNDTQTVIAFGAGAITKFVSLEDNRILRSANYKQLKDYLDHPEDMAERKRRIRKNMV